MDLTQQDKNITEIAFTIHSSGRDNRREFHIDSIIQCSILNIVC